MDSMIASLALQAIYTVCAFIFGYVWNKSKSLSSKSENIERGVQILLKATLLTIHKDSMARGYIPYDVQAIAEETYEAYHNLGGNGQGTEMIKDIRGLDVRNDPLKHHKDS